MKPELVNFKITGNIVPPIWYKRITFANGKPHLLAINILADIVYWHRPFEIRDEYTGQVIECRPKFKGDLLSRSYNQICNFFGCSPKQAKDSLVLLEKMGLIERVVRLVRTDRFAQNCLFIKLNVEAVKKISFLDTEQLYKNLTAAHTIESINSY